MAIPSFLFALIAGVIATGGLIEGISFRAGRLSFDPRSRGASVASLSPIENTFWALQLEAESDAHRVYNVLPGAKQLRPSGALVFTNETGIEAVAAALGSSFHGATPLPPMFKLDPQERRHHEAVVRYPSPPSATCEENLLPDGTVAPCAQALETPSSTHPSQHMWNPSGLQMVAFLPTADMLGFNIGRRRRAALRGGVVGAGSGSRVDVDASFAAAEAALEAEETAAKSVGEGLCAQVCSVAEKALDAVQARAQAQGGEAEGVDAEALAPTPRPVCVMSDVKLGLCLVTVATRSAAVTHAVVDAMIEIPFVHFVDFVQRSELHMDQSAAHHTSGAYDGDDDGAHPIWDKGIFGQGELVHTYDTGVAMGSCQFSDSRFNVQYWKVRKSGNTVVQVNAAGDGALTDETGADKAYGAISASSHRKVVGYLAYTPHLTTFIYTTNSSSNEQVTDGLDYENGHGTGVAGCIAGLPESVYNLFRSCFDGDSSVCQNSGVNANSLRSQFSGSNTRTYGTAPGAKLVVSDIALNNYVELRKIGVQAYVDAGMRLVGFFGGELVDYHFKPSYAAGVRTSTSSVGEPAERSTPYDSYTQFVDDFIWNNDDFLLLIAGGNSGGQGTTEWVMNPAISKNALTVGSAQINFQSVTRAAHSSLGPTADKRIKPDVLVKGINIVGVGNPGPTQTQSSFLTDSAHCATAFRAGTSFATPTTAGLVTLVRQYLREGYYPTGVRTSSNQMTAAQMKASLLKAYIIASARPYDVSDASAYKPDGVQGHGVPVLADVLLFDHAGTTLKRANAKRLTYHKVSTLSSTATFKYHSFVFNLKSSAEALRVVLAWTDPPADANQAATDKTLQNDLDLTLEHPGSGRKWFGNHGTSKDTLNNVEALWLPAAATPPSGRYVVTVRLDSLRAGETEQEYSLVIAGPIEWADNEAAPVIYYTEPPQAECETAVECGVTVTEPFWVEKLGNDYSKCNRNPTDGGRPRCNCWPPGAYDGNDRLCENPMTHVAICSGKGVIDASTNKCACFRDNVNGFYEGDQCQNCFGDSSVPESKRIQRDGESKCRIFPIANCFETASTGGNCKQCNSDSNWISSGRKVAFWGGWQVVGGAGEGQCECKGAGTVGPTKVMVSASFPDRGLTGVWSGPQCRALQLPAPTTQCAGHGQIDVATGYCKCDNSPSKGYWGGQLDLVPDTTTSYMTCVRCREGYAGPSCKCQVSAQGVCDGRGTCTESGCVCGSSSAKSSASSPSVTVYDGNPFVVSGVTVYKKYTYTVSPGHYATDRSVCKDIAAGDACADNCATCASGWTRPTGSDVTDPCLCEVSPAGDVCYGHGVCTPTGCACFDDDNLGRWSSSRLRSSEVTTRCDVCASGYWGAGRTAGTLTNSEHCTCFGSETGLFSDVCNRHGRCVRSGNTSVCECNTQEGAVGKWAGKACERCAEGFVGPGRGPPPAAFGQDWCACRDWGLNVSDNEQECGGHGTCAASGCSCATGFTDSAGGVTNSKCDVCAPDYESPEGAQVATCKCLKGCGGRGICGVNGCECRNLDKPPWNTVDHGFWAPAGAELNSSVDFYVGPSCDACAPDYKPEGKCNCQPDSGCKSEAPLNVQQIDYPQPLSASDLALTYLPSIFTPLPNFGCVTCNCETAGTCATSTFRDLSTEPPNRLGSDWMGTFFEVVFATEGVNSGTGGGSGGVATLTPANPAPKPVTVTRTPASGSAVTKTAAPAPAPVPVPVPAPVSTGALREGGSDLDGGDRGVFSAVEEAAVSALRQGAATPAVVDHCAEGNGVRFASVGGDQGVMRITARTTVSVTNVSSCDPGSEGSRVHAYALVPSGGGSDQWVRADAICPPPYALPSGEEIKIISASPDGTNCAVHVPVCCVFPSPLSSSSFELKVALFREVEVRSAWDLIREWFIPIAVVTVLVLAALIALIVWAVWRARRAARHRRKMELVAQYILGRRDGTSTSLRKRLHLSPGVAFSEVRAAKLFSAAAHRSRLLAARLEKGTVRVVKEDEASTGSMALLPALLALATRGVHPHETFGEREAMPLRAAKTLRASFMNHPKHGPVLKPGLAPSDILRMIYLQTQIEKLSGGGVTHTR